jgi:hypothetical protein
MSPDPYIYSLMVDMLDHIQGLIDAGELNASTDLSNRIGVLIAVAQGDEPVSTYDKDPKALADA